jgi:hypothetical protein
MIITRTAPHAAAHNGSSCACNYTCIDHCRRTCYASSFGSVHTDARKSEKNYHRRASTNVGGHVEMSSTRSRAPFMTWFTCGFENRDHAISEGDMENGLSRGEGRYLAVCGVTVSVSSMMCPPGRRCRSCDAVVRRVAHDYASSRSTSTGFLSRLFGRGRRRDGSQAAMGHRLFGQRRKTGAVRSPGSRGD